jgi:hypothetical protein
MHIGQEHVQSSAKISFLALKVLDHTTPYMYKELTSITILIPTCRLFKVCGCYLVSLLN